MFSASDKDGNTVQIEDAISGVDYKCSYCGKSMIIRAKNSKSVHVHFAHERGTDCPYAKDHDMSPWHREWQRRFDPKYREVRIQIGGDIHRADICIDDTIIEFQHSPISKERFDGRNEFYLKNGYKLIWIFDISERINPTGLYRGLRIKRKIDCLDKYDIRNSVYNLFVQQNDSLYFVEKVNGNAFSIRDTKYNITPDDFVNEMTKEESFEVTLKLEQYIYHKYFRLPQGWSVFNLPEYEAMKSKMKWIPDIRV